MSTVNDLVNDSLIEIGVLRAGDDPAPEDSDLAFSRLNKLIEDLNTDRMMVYAISEDLYLLPANTQEPTIGTSGTIVATRPERIENANLIDISDTTISGSTATTGAGDKILTDSGKDFTALGITKGRDLVYVVSGTGVTAGIYRITAVGTTTLTLETDPGSSGSAISYRVIRIPYRSPIDVTQDHDYWAALRTRGVIGVPTDLFYNPTYPNGTIKLNSYLTAAACLELFAWTVLSSFSSLADTVSFPPGYYNLLMYKLAIRCSVPFDEEIKPATLLEANKAEARILSINSQNPPRMQNTAPGARRKYSNMNFTDPRLPQ
jgi:hypothetical protein